MGPGHNDTLSNLITSFDMSSDNCDMFVYFETPFSHTLSWQKSQTCWPSVSPPWMLPGPYLQSLPTSCPHPQNPSQLGLPGPLPLAVSARPGSKDHAQHNHSLLEHFPPSSRIHYKLIWYYILNIKLWQGDSSLGWFRISALFSPPYSHNFLMLKNIVELFFDRPKCPCGKHSSKYLTMVCPREKNR